MATRRDDGVRANAVERFLGSCEGKTWEEAMALYRQDITLYRWNAETQRAVLRAMRAKYEG